MANMPVITPGRINATHEMICLDFPPNISSPGFAPWLKIKHTLEGFMHYYIQPRLYVEIILICFLTIALNGVKKCLGLPNLISQLIAGMILGPTLLGGRFSLFEMSKDDVEAIGTVAWMGYVFFLFLSGVKMDVSMAYKSGKKAVFIGSLTVIIPLLFCLGIDWTFYMGDVYMFLRDKGVFLAVTYSGTSFPVIHNLLNELKIQNSQLGRLGLSAALVGDILSQLLLNISYLMEIGHKEKKISPVLKPAGLAICYALVAVVVFRIGIKWVLNYIPNNRHVNNIIFHVVVLGFLITPWITNKYIVFFTLFGPFLIGLVIPDGPPIGSALVDQLDPIISGLFLPLFAATCGMRIDFTPLNTSTSSTSPEQNLFKFVQSVGIIMSIIIKFVVSLLLSLLCNMPVRDSFALAFILVTKGIVDMASYSHLADSRVLPKDLFAFMSVIIMVVASVVLFMVRTIYDPSRKYISYQKKSIMHSKPNEVLRLFGCINIPSNVYSIINILNAFRPTQESPIAVDVLHLVKLSGQASPILINHSKHKEISDSYSENVVISFNQFEMENRGASSVNVFTAVTQTNLMSEEVCHLAMDQLSSFIILPFHRSWHGNGSMESDDQNIRSLNCEILEKAPCSVGILIEGRRQLKRCGSTLSVDNPSSSYNIAVIFLGGKDDREALALAARKSQDETVGLTVIHLIAANGLGNAILSEDKILDDMMLRTVKGIDSMTYIEEKVNGGPETSDFLKTIVDDFQLIIVGRRYNLEDCRTIGLEEWCEFPEIGLIGDLLISPDFGGSHFVLVVQQQLQ